MGFYTCPAGFLLSAARLEEILPGQFRSVPIPLAESPRYHGVPRVPPSMVGSEGS